MKLERIQALGCIVCELNYDLYSPADLHHPLSGGKRISKTHVIPLCPQHHRLHVFSRHRNKRKFIELYGTEEYLHEETSKLYEATYAIQTADA